MFTFFNMKVVLLSHIKSVSSFSFSPIWGENMIWFFATLPDHKQVPEHITAHCPVLSAESMLISDNQSWNWSSECFDVLSVRREWCHRGVDVSFKMTSLPPDTHTHKHTTIVRQWYNLWCLFSAPHRTRRVEFNEPEQLHDKNTEKDQMFIFLQPDLKHKTRPVIQSN